MSARKSALAAAEVGPPATEPVTPKGKTGKGSHKPAPHLRAPVAKKKGPKYSSYENSAKIRNHEASLRVAHDRRLREITKVAGREEFNDLVAASGAQTSCPMDQKARSTLPIFPSAIRRDRENIPDVAARDNTPYVFTPLVPLDQNLEGKTAYAESFDSTLKRLLIDFELSADANCRTNHLNRLHAWFHEQGGKKARQPKTGLHYPALEHPPGGTAGRWPKGSPRNNDSQLSEACVMLSNSMRMKKTPQLMEAASRWRLSRASMTL